MGTWLNYRHVGESYYINREGILKCASLEDISNDRKNNRNSIEKEFDQRQTLIDPPKVLSDHSAVNYSAHLERQISC